MHQSVLLIIAGIIGSTVTYSLQKAGLNAILSSAIVGLFAGFLGQYTSHSNVAAALFCGSFVGMTSINLMPIMAVAIAGGTSGFIYYYTQSLFKGFGGKLGTIAFISVGFTFILLLFSKKNIAKLGKLLNNKQ
ncbi:hypothetical protein OO013_02680 [Mangrovivirga sp. M17]|uniref:DUF4203 domain-containing protein n=1 Tax=Mangrovivirga halotolerans TaxID=2993936 RepID=A0ABT3RMB7_9BACT|nr:hypothetical protein [Mangrovivirga halotolerans]MCX2742752.1 hypothetical protein [Mangrovivirga halotolerans]